MLIVITWIIALQMVQSSIGNPIPDENVPVKKIIIQDKVVYKMRHDFWPKKDQRNGILPYLEIISRKRRSSEANETVVEDNTDINSVTAPYLTTLKTVEIPRADRNYIDEYLNNKKQNNSMDVFITNATEANILHLAKQQGRFEVSNTESTITEREEKVVILDLDEAENTLIFRPLFAYRYKKHRQKLKRQRSVSINISDNPA